MRADVNSDGQVDFKDFLVVANNFGKEVAEGDLNDDNRPHRATKF